MTSDASVTITARDGIYASNDGGESWANEWGSAKEDEILRLEFLPSKVGIAVGKGGLILRRSATK
jgi:photosystem II stability/assembly factor-like uncharacterized protein